MTAIKKERPMKLNARFIVGVLALILAGYAQMAAAAGPVAKPVFPIKSHPYGKSYAVWGQEFAQWIYSFSLEDYPLFQPSGEVNCGNAQTGKVWFLYGALEDGVTRGCTVPKGTALFIAVNVTTSFVPLFGTTEEEIRADAQRDLDGIQTMDVSIDGVPLNDPFGFRASSPDGGFVFTIEPDSVLNEIGVPADDYYPAIVDGYWLMVPPLSVGEHTMGWSSSGFYQDGSYYSYSVNWNLHITP